MKHLSSKTNLTDRTLWYDGHTTVVPDRVERLIMEGIDPTKLHVTEMTQAIEIYNHVVPKEERITVKDSCDPLSLSWNLPDEYLNLNIPKYLGQKLIERCEGKMSEEEFARRVRRLADELKLYKRHDLYGFLRTIIFVINTLSSSKQIWGVGRGSSVSSFVLYIIGVHDVDSVKYDLEVSDFLK